MISACHFFCGAIVFIHDVPGDENRRSSDLFIRQADVPVSDFVLCEFVERRSGLRADLSRKDFTEGFAGVGQRIVRCFQEVGEASQVIDRVDVE